MGNVPDRPQPPATAYRLVAAFFDQYNAWRYWAGDTVELQIMSPVDGRATRWFLPAHRGLATAFLAYCKRHGLKVSNFGPKAPIQGVEPT